MTKALVLAPIVTTTIRTVTARRAAAPARAVAAARRIAARAARPAPIVVIDTEQIAALRRLGLTNF